MNNETDVDYYLYLDGKMMGGYIGLASCLYADMKTVRPLFSKVDSVMEDNDNQFTVVLKALKNAIQLLKDNNIRGSVVILNQNQTLLQWIQNGECNSNYTEQFADVMNDMSLLQFKCSFFLQHIQLKENKAKNLCKMAKAPKVDHKQLNKVSFKPVSFGSFPTNSKDTENNDYEENETNIIELRNIR